MPTAAEIAPLQQILAAVLTGPPRSHHALTIVPILAPMQAEPAWLTLAEAGDRVQGSSPRALARPCQLSEIGFESHDLLDKISRLLRRWQA